MVRSLWRLNPLLLVISNFTENFLVLENKVEQNGGGDQGEGLEPGRDEEDGAGRRVDGQRVDVLHEAAGRQVCDAGEHRRHGENLEWRQNVTNWSNTVFVTFYSGRNQIQLFQELESPNKNYKELENIWAQKQHFIAFI